MSNSIILQRADQAYQECHYENALAGYKEAEATSSIFTNNQLYRYAKLLFERGENDTALLQAEKIDEVGREDFNTAVLLYRLKKASGVHEEELVELLEAISKISYDEELMMALAILYAKAGSQACCKRVCKQMINCFRSGKWVEQAQELLNADGIIQETATSFVKEKMSSEGLLTSTQKDFPEAKNETKADATPDFLNDAFAGIIGMDSVKNELKRFYDLARIEKLRMEKLGVSANSDRGYNFILYGNPGTGKTTVARIIGKALFSLGIRENDVLLKWIVASSLRNILAVQQR